MSGQAGKWQNKQDALKSSTNKCIISIYLSIGGGS